MLAITEQWSACRRRRAPLRKAYYFSAEYLIGRLISGDLYNLGILEEMRTAFAQRGVDLNSLEDVEDMALGNGGLGRLAACFLDSAATHDIPLDGYGLRYKFGLFRQTFENCRQMEAPDDWTKWGDAWSVRRDDLAVTVPMRTGEVVAVPYDMPVIGLRRAQHRHAAAVAVRRARRNSTSAAFNAQEYCAGSRRMKNARRGHHQGALPQRHRLGAGKQLRIKQQYVLCSAPACRTSCAAIRPITASHWENLPSAMRRAAQRHAPGHGHPRTDPAAE